MQWVDQFQLFLFDFDGLLVDTERLHYDAYVEMLFFEGLTLSWDFATFCQYAHRNADALREKLYEDFPSLDHNWSRLYAVKKELYQNRLQKGQVSLMPGVEELLSFLAKKDAKRCVVTNSFLSQVQVLRALHPILQTIPHWITRENYQNPKPAADGYLKAIELYGKPQDQIIGFEDSLRGITSLQAAGVFPVLICPPYHPLLQEIKDQGIRSFESLSLINL